MWKRQRKQSRTSKEGTHFSHSQTAPSNVLVRLFRLFTIQLIIITNELNLCKARQKMYPFAIPRENTASMKMNRCSAKDHVHSRGGVQEGRSPGQHPISHCSSRYRHTQCKFTKFCFEPLCPSFVWCEEVCRCALGGG